LVQDLGSLPLALLLQRSAGNDNEADKKKPGAFAPGFSDIKPCPASPSARKRLEGEVAVARSRACV